MVAIENDLRAETTAYESAERRIKNWAFESKQIKARHAEFEAVLRASRLRSSDGDLSKAAETVRVFQQEPRKKPRSRKEQERERQRLADARLAQRQQARKAEQRKRRGKGDFLKCDYCLWLWRGVPGDECPRCKGDLELLTARGKQSRGGPIPEPQPPMMTLSIDAALLDSIISNIIPPWAGNAIRRTFLWSESTEKSSNDLQMLPGAFTQRVKASVRHVAIALAKHEDVRVMSASNTPLRSV